MRYKEQSINKIEQIETILRLTFTQINKNETRENVLSILENLKEKLAELRSLIDIEPGDFFSSK